MTVPPWARMARTICRCFLAALVHQASQRPLTATRIMRVRKLYWAHQRFSLRWLGLRGAMSVFGAERRFWGGRFRRKGDQVQRGFETNKIASGYCRAW